MPSGGNPLVDHGANAVAQGLVLNVRHLPPLRALPRGCFFAVLVLWSFSQDAATVLEPFLSWGCVPILTLLSRHGTCLTQYDVFEPLRFVTFGVGS